MLDLVHLLCYFIEKYSRQQNRRVDEQSLLWFLSIIGLYLLIPISALIFLRFLVENYKNTLNIVLAAILNIHVFVVIVIYIKDVLI